jgi:predicted O-linked N-acetylglucosamine transferase (SPINDLY family)
MTTLAQALHQALGYHQRGHLPQAEQLYRQILQVAPNHVDALHLLGVLANQVGKSDLAIDYLNQALRLNPNFAEAHNNLGNALESQGRLAEAVASYEQAIRLKPDYAIALYNLGNTLRSQGKLDELVAIFRRTVQIKPDFAEAHNNLGNALRDQGRLDEAVACFQQALRLEPNLAAAHCNLGQALEEQGKLEEAVACYQQALRLNPDLAEAYNNLGNALKGQGLLDEALTSFRRAMERKAGYGAAHSNLVLTLHCCPGSDPSTIFEELGRWNQQYAEPLSKFIQPHANDRSPDRRLRIGYLSPDFRRHPVGLFLLPLLEAHDHERFEILCYDALNIPDEVTDRCRAQADGWREVRSLSDEQLAHAIREDRIDILVDLAMHAWKNRLAVFARKPAPVQVTYLAYCSSTGLRTMDYRLTDPYLDPPGRDEPFYSEQSIHLPETYWCFRPIIETPPVNPLPAFQTGRVTFGCLNNFCKVTAPTLATWGRLLQAQPEARLVLHAHPGGTRDRVRESFARYGVAPDRLTFVGRVGMVDYFHQYHGIDVALDPFPFGGGTTTCDALWMGVPVVSLAGQTAVGRGGLSILSNVGLAELVARDADEYVRRALELADNRPRLGELRATLRERMRASPLMDAPRFARGIEAAYRDMWRRWCARSMSSGGEPLREIVSHATRRL